MTLFKYFLVSLFLTLIITGCSTSSTVSVEDMDEASISADSLISLIPNYSRGLETLAGTGRAMVSQPGSSDRVTVQFYSDRDRSLLTVRSSGGIEGAQILIDSDSLLIYNKVDKVAEKASLRQSNLSSVGSIASVNMLDLFNFTFSASDIEAIYEDENNYGVVLESSATATLSKSNGLIQQVTQPPGTEEAAYSKIIYEGYAEIRDFYLPRKITIFSGDGDSRATFLVQQLEVNEALPPLEIVLPDDIPIYRP